MEECSENEIIEKNSKMILILFEIASLTRWCENYYKSVFIWDIELFETKVHKLPVEMKKKAKSFCLPQSWILNLIVNRMLYNIFFYALPPAAANTIAKLLESTN